MSTIQSYPDELDYVNAKLCPSPLTVQQLEAMAQAARKCGVAGPLYHGRLCVLEPECGSFLEAFCRACLAADSENYELIRPLLRLLIQKYPADYFRLAMERHDRGASTDEDEQIIRGRMDRA